MEKVFINPVAKEILIKGGAKEGPVDLFSYDGNGNGRSLGSLFLVGNIQSATPEEPLADDIDVGYVLNLVASLAKREYYANADLNPKDAFAGALKKVNGVVEEFFKKKDTKINIGIFAIAGEQIHISKLGKFKIFLARDGKNIDILNNIQLFNKEIIEEKEFSNIISGKILEGDRLLAFYPNRVVTAREKALKESLLNSSQDEFAAHVASIKEAKPDFSCVALHIDMQKATEVAHAPRVQPKELRKEEAEDIEVPAAQLAATEKELAEDDEVAIEEPPVVIQKPVAHTISKLSAEPPIPKIIPSEFARGKRELAFAKHVRRIKQMNITPRLKAITMGGIAVVAILTVVGLKSFVFVSASTKQINAAVAEAQENLKLAQSKLSQSDFIGARSLLVSSLASLTQNDSSTKKVSDAKADLIKALDAMDNATDAQLSMLVEIPAESGTAKLVTAAGSNFYVYLDQKDNSGALAKVATDGVGATTQIKDISPDGIFTSDAHITIVDSSAKKIAALSTSKSTLSTSTFSGDPLINYEIYNDNLYGLTASGITKITDAALGHTAITQWLTDNLATNPSLITVDGNVYVLSSSGVLTTYYKGKKKSESTTAVAPDTGSLLLTNTDSPNLFLINIATGRIYVISKDSGAVSKTLKTNATITHATLGSDDTVYLLSDNKIWQVK